jgi:hypothetical protein
VHLTSHSFRWGGARFRGYTQKGMMIDRTLCIYFMISRPAASALASAIACRPPSPMPLAGRTELEGDVRRAGASLVGPLGRDGRAAGGTSHVRATSGPHGMCPPRPPTLRLARVYFTVCLVVGKAVRGKAVRRFYDFFAYSTPTVYTPVASGMLYQSHPTVKRTIFTACYEYVAISSMLRPEASRSATKSGSRPDGDSGTTLGLGAAAAVPLAPPPRPFWAAAAVSVSP